MNSAIVRGVPMEWDRTGTGPDLLLLHSLLTDLTVFEPMLPRLAARWRVTRVNLPGYGGSPPIEARAVAEHADHVAAAMDVLELPHSTALFGNGFGGFVALETAIRHGGRFDALLIADALAAFPEPARVPFRAMAERVESQGMQAVLDTAIGRMFPPGFAAAHPAQVAERKTALARADAGAFARACRALAALDLRSQLRLIANPTLVTVGALDATTPPEHAEALARGIPGAVFRTIPDCGHCPMLEQPDLLAAAIEAFSDQLRSAAPKNPRSSSTKAS